MQKVEINVNFNMPKDIDNKLILGGLRHTIQIQKIYKKYTQRNKSKFFM